MRTPAPSAMSPTPAISPIGGDDVVGEPAPVAGNPQHANPERPTSIYGNPDTHAKLLIDTEPDMCFPTTLCCGKVHVKAYPSLFFHRKLTSIRYSISILLFINILLFIVADQSVLTIVDIEIGFSKGHSNKMLTDFIGKLTQTLPDVKNQVLITFGHLITQSMEGKMYALLIAILITSIIWPFYKILWTMTVWLLPTHRIGVTSAEYAILLVNALGKVALFLVPMSVCLATAMHIVIAPTLQVFLPTELSQTAQNLEKLAGPAQSILENIINPSGTAVEVVNLPIYIDITLVTAAGGYLFVACVLLSQLVSQIIQQAHYFAHRSDVYNEVITKTEADSKGLNKKANSASLFRLYGAGIGTLAILLCIASFALEVAGITSYSVSMQYHGVVGVLLEETNPGASSQQLTLSSLSDFHWGNIMIEILLVSLAGILPLIHCCVMVAMVTIPMSLKQHNDAFTMMYSFCLLDVTMVAVGISFPMLENFIDVLIGDKCDGLNAFLRTSALKHMLFDGETRCFGLDAQLMEGYWFLLAAAILHWVAFALTQNYSRKAWLSAFSDYDAGIWAIKKKNTHCGILSCLIWPFFMPICLCPVDVDRKDGHAERSLSFDDMLLDADMANELGTVGSPILSPVAAEVVTPVGTESSAVDQNLAIHEV